MVAWSLAVVLALFICAWPLLSGMAAANDDLKFFRSAEFAGALAEDIRHSWSHLPNFRPLENVAALLCDEQTLECRMVMVIQIAGALALIWALARLTRRLLPDPPLALPLLIIWLALSPATTIAIWQMDTCSQTWTAALAAWCGVLTISGIDAARAGRGIAPQLAWLMLLCAVAVNIKEMFYGWSAGIGLMLIAVILWLLRREPLAARRSLWLLMPIVALPAAHLLLRLKFSALGSAIGSAAEAGDAGNAARYQVALGANIVRNLGLSALGVFSNGPLHQVTNVDAPVLARLAPLASLIAAFVALAAAALLAVLHRSDRPAAPRRALLLASIAGILSVSITLPMGSVSELYGFGANIASGLLVVAALRSLWNPVAADERTMCRSIAVVCAGVLLAVGVLGVASRAYHFRLTWLYARELNRVVLEHQQSLAPQSPREPPSHIYFERRCYSGQMHSQYIVSPVQAIGITETMDWMNRRNPTRPVVFATMAIPTNVRPIDLVITCDSLPVRQPW